MSTRLPATSSSRPIEMLASRCSTSYHSGEVKWVKRCEAHGTSPPLRPGDLAVTDRPAPIASAEPHRQLASTRRDFLKGSTMAGAAVVSSGLIVPMVHAAGSGTIKVGLVGCGGRGTGAAEQALTADSGTRLVAMADAFPDRLEDSLSALKGVERRLPGRRAQGPPVQRASTPTSRSSTRSTSCS